MVTVDHKRRKGLGPKQSLVFVAFAEAIANVNYNRQRTLAKINLDGRCSC